MNIVKLSNPSPPSFLRGLTTDEDIVENWSPEEVLHNLRSGQLKCYSGNHSRYASSILWSFLERNLCNARSNRIIKILLDNGADPMYRGTDRELSAYKAFKGGDTDIAVTFLRHLPHIDHRLDKHGRTALHVFVEFHNESHLHEVLKLKPDLNFKDADHLTPLYLAVRLYRYEKVQILIEHGAEVNCTDAEGYTPLHWACEKMGRKDIIKLLLQNGAEVKGTYEVDSPLYLLLRSYRPEVLELCELLLQKGSDPGYCSTRGNTSIQYLLTSNLFPVNQAKKVIKLLVKYGASLNSSHTDGSRTLHYYARTELNTFVEEKHFLSFMLENGADMNMVDARNETVLDIYKRHDKSVQALFLLKLLAISELKDDFTIGKNLLRSVESSKVFVNYLSSCRRELSRLVSYRFEDTKPFSVFDVLAEKDEVILARYLRVEKLRFAMNLFKFEDFPIYGVDIQTKCLEGMKRHRAEMEGLRDLRRLLPRGPRALTKNCLMNVLKYLTTYELRRITHRMHPTGNDACISHETFFPSLRILFR